MTHIFSLLQVDVKGFSLLIPDKKKLKGKANWMQNGLYSVPRHVQHRFFLSRDIENVDCSHHRNRFDENSIFRLLPLVLKATAIVFPSLP